MSRVIMNQSTSDMSDLHINDNNYNHFLPVIDMSHLEPGTHLIHDKIRSIRQLMCILLKYMYVHIIMVLSLYICLSIHIKQLIFIQSLSEEKK